MRFGRAFWLWAVAVPAMVFGATAGVLIVRVVASANSAALGPPRFVSTGGVFTKGNGQAAPGWSVPSLADPALAVTLRQFRGRPVVVNFWASWCTPCRKEMPALEQVSRLLAGRVSFVGLDTQDQSAAGLAFARRMTVTYPLAIANARLWSAYRIQALPTTFFISSRGAVVGEDFGGLTRNSLLRLVRNLYGVTPAS